MRKTTPSHLYLHEALVYDPVAGSLTWRPRPRHHFADEADCRRWNRKYADTVAFVTEISGPGSHLRGRINGVAYLAHRIIWKMVTGEEPPDIPDHKDRNKQNNAWSNLEPSDPHRNAMNTALRRTNRTGVRGVSVHHRASSTLRYTAKRCGKYLGTFASLEEAKAAVEAGVNHG